MLGALLCSLCYPVNQAIAQSAQSSTSAYSDYYTPGDGAHRINMSGKLRMLSQRIPGMACNAASGIRVEESEAALGAATQEFEQILAALKFGDEALSITDREDNRKTLSFIADVEAQWIPFAEHAKYVLAADDAGRHFTSLAADSGPLLGSAADLVHRIVNVYFDPVTTRQSDAMTIDFAGRQRMLAQRMSKNVCLINEGVQVEQAREELADAYGLFDATLTALQTGMPSAGVSPPPNEAVEAGLQTVVAAWAKVSPLMERAMQGETFDATLRAEVFDALNTLTFKMNTVVHLYSDATAYGGAA